MILLLVIIFFSAFLVAIGEFYNYFKYLKIHKNDENIKNIKSKKLKELMIALLTCVSLNAGILIYIGFNYL